MKVLSYALLSLLAGGFGIDFSENRENVEEGVAKVAKGLLAHGVTSFCPTIVTSPPETYHRVLPKIKKREGGKEGAAILGVHCEGPFISAAKKGAHQETCIRTFDKVLSSLCSNQRLNQFSMDSSV